MTINNRNGSAPPGSSPGRTWGNAPLRPYQQRQLDRRQEKAKAQTGIIYDMLVIFVLLHFFGFPGRLTLAFGDKIETLVDYGCFGLQLGMMLMSSGDNYLDVKLINLKGKFKTVYIFAAVIIVEAMLVSEEKAAEAITCARLLTTISFAFWMGERYEPEELLMLYYRAQILFVMATLFFLVRYRGLSYARNQDEMVFVGLFPAKNETGAELAFGILIQLTIIRLKMDKHEPISVFFLGMIAVQMALLLLAKAVGALFTAIIPIGYVFVLEPKLGKKKRLPLGFVYVVGSIGFLMFALTIIPLFQPLFEMLGKDATLTGRIPLWNQLINVIMNNRPITGYGYERFWKNSEAVALLHAGFDKDSWFAKMTVGSHCVTMEMLVNTGIVGVGIYYLMIIDTLKSVKEMREDRYVFCATFMLMFMIYGWTERSMAPAMSHTLYLFIVLGIGCGTEKRKKTVNRRLKPNERA